MSQTITFENGIPPAFSWLNQPQSFTADGGLRITSDPRTDFWQRTHYGFRNDNAHALLTPLNGDFCLSTHVVFQPQQQYDQCGLLVRLDADNWIKLSTEYETVDLSMLGSVVTNLGYSDWATTELDGDPGQMWYRISRRGDDYLLQSSFDGQAWQQLRIAHLHQSALQVQGGIYACSPMDGRFNCTFTYLEIADNAWFQPSP